MENIDGVKFNLTGVNSATQLTDTLIRTNNKTNWIKEWDYPWTQNDYSYYGAEDYDYPTLELDQPSQTVLITLYTFTSLLSVVGNITVIVVLLCGRQCKTELTVFLVNLALADLCMACFCMPFTFTVAMLGRWIFGSFMCPLVLFMQVTSVAVSIFTNMAIGIDRYWHVMYPLKPRLTKSKARLFLLAIWFLSICLGGAQLAVARTGEQYYARKKFYDCNEKWPSKISRHSYTVAVAALTYVIPLLILSLTYYKVGAQLWMRRTPGNAHESRDVMLLKAKRKVIKMVVILVVVFAVCWLPLQLFNLILDFAPQVMELRSSEEERRFLAIYYTCHWLAMANSFTNPLIYGFVNDNFRADLKWLFHRIPCVHIPPSSCNGDTGATMSSTLYTKTSIRSMQNRSLPPKRTVSVSLPLKHYTNNDSLRWKRSNTERKMVTIKDVDEITTETKHAFCRELSGTPNGQKAWITKLTGQSNTAQHELFPLKSKITDNSLESEESR